MSSEYVPTAEELAIANKVQKHRLAQGRASGAPRGPTARAMLKEGACESGSIRRDDKAFQRVVLDLSSEKGQKALAATLRRANAVRDTAEISVVGSTLVIVDSAS